MSAFLKAFKQLSQVMKLGEVFQLIFEELMSLNLIILLRKCVLKVS